MTTLYMVGRISFTYNDEIYSSGEDEGVDPIKLFRSKEAAELAANILTAKFFKQSGKYHPTFCDYFYDVDDIVDDTETFWAMLAKYGVAPKCENDELDEAVAKMPEEELVKLLYLTSLNFFTVHEVDLAESAIEMLTSPEAWEREVGEKLKTKESNKETA